MSNGHDLNGLPKCLRLGEARPVSITWTRVVVSRGPYIQAQWATPWATFVSYLGLN